MKNISTIFNYIVDFFYPRRCVVCDELLEIGSTICSECRKKIILIEEPMCKKCGKEVKLDDELCFDCKKKEHAFIEGHGLYRYNKHMKESIVRFKYNARGEYAKFYADSIVEYYGDYIRDKKIDVIIPVPIHKNRLQKRGYNQAELIAKNVGKQLGIPVLSKALERVVDTTPQKELDNVKRGLNLMDAIRINNKSHIPDYVNNILLIDDIYTTGTTMDVCSKVLKNSNKNYNIYFISVAIGNGV